MQCGKQKPCTAHAAQRFSITLGVKMHKYAVSEVPVDEKIRTPFSKKRTGFGKKLALQIKNLYVGRFSVFSPLSFTSFLHKYTVRCINIPFRTND